jgi:hypothetical protein
MYIKFINSTLPTMAVPPTTLHLAQALPVFPNGSENEHQLDLPTIAKPATPQIAPRPELILPVPATGPGHEHDDDFTASETTAHLGGGLALHDLNVTGMGDWRNATGGWDFGGMAGGMGMVANDINNGSGGWNFGGMSDGMGMVLNDINDGSGWGFLDELMNADLPMLHESLQPVQSESLPTQQFLRTVSPTIFPQPTVLLNSFASGTDAEPQPQANIVPLDQSPFAQGTDAEPQPQANEGDLAPGTDSNATQKTSDMPVVESGERLGTRNRRKPTESREVVPLTARQDSDKLPDWLELASKYLYDGIELQEWKECLDIWMGFEKEVGYLEMTAVSTTTKFTYISLTKGFPASFGR